MSTGLTPLERPEASTPLPRLAGVATPVLFSPSPQAERRFWEFFTAHIRNPNTRLAYLTAARRFAAWCERRGLALDQVEPMVVAAYVEQLSGALSAPSVKQHLAALRMLFDWLVVGQVLPFNPANSVRGPKHVVKSGKTPVLSAAETRALLDGIDVATLAGLRDRALLGILVYSFARVTAAVSMRVGDYYTQGPRSFFRLHEKGGALQRGAGPPLRPSLRRRLPRIRRHRRGPPRPPLSPLPARAERRSPPPADDTGHGAQGHQAPRGPHRPPSRDLRPQLPRHRDHRVPA